MPLALNDQHGAIAIARATQQLQGKPHWEAFLGALTDSVQGVENAMWDLFSLRFLSTAENDQLDQIGAVVGEDRQGFSDSDYRLHIQARILMNRSSGTGTDLIGMFQILTDPAALITLNELFPAAFELDVSSFALGTQLSTYLPGFLRSAKAAAVRSIFRWTPTDEAHTFCCSGGAGLGFGDSTDPSTGGQFSGAL